MKLRKSDRFSSDKGPARPRRTLASRPGLMGRHEPPGPGVGMTAWTVTARRPAKRGCRGRSDSRFDGKQATLMRNTTWQSRSARRLRPGGKGTRTRAVARPGTGRTVTDTGRTAVGRAGSFNPEEPRSSWFCQGPTDLHFRKNGIVRRFNVAAAQAAQARLFK